MSESNVSRAMSEWTGKNTGVWYCPFCGYIDPKTRGTHCPKQHPKPVLFVEAVYGYYVRVGFEELRADTAATSRVKGVDG